MGDEKKDKAELVNYIVRHMGFLINHRDLLVETNNFKLTKIARIVFEKKEIICKILEVEEEKENLPKTPRRLENLQKLPYDPKFDMKLMSELKFVLKDTFQIRGFFWCSLEWSGDDNYIFLLPKIHVVFKQYANYIKEEYPGTFAKFQVDPHPQRKSRSHISVTFDGDRFSKHDMKLKQGEITKMMLDYRRVKVWYGNFEFKRDDPVKETFGKH